MDHHVGRSTESCRIDNVYNSNEQRRWMWVNSATTTTPCLFTISQFAKTSSAVYLAALAIIDLVYLLARSIYKFIIVRHLYDVVCGDPHSWLCSGTDELFNFLSDVTCTIEPLLVLSFSVERLIAILRPLKVCRQRALRRELLREQASYDLLYIILIRH